MSKNTKITKDMISTSEVAPQVQELAISYKSTPDDLIFEEIIELVKPMMFNFIRSLRNEYIETKRYEFNYDYDDIINIYYYQVFNAIQKYDLNSDCLFTTYLYRLFECYTMRMRTVFYRHIDFAITSVNVPVNNSADDSDGCVGDYYVDVEYGYRQKEFELVESLKKLINESDLPARRKEIFTFYVENNDLTLSEVARAIGLSSQRVHEVIKKSNKNFLQDLSKLILA